ncbi:hypothetical protein KI387_010173 [Taxus chinensis]|uniref:Uncharacterized protein n=1 Tax=Taxus chinensis TaxID=29808 RepID=A0AA38FKI1_TAXCH|nr:hypothetical protein KI387_010173 [Taxus chinensis]
MGGQLKRIEPASCSSIREDEEVWNILMDNGITTFLERMVGHSTLVSYAVMATWARGRVQIGNTRFSTFQRTPLPLQLVFRPLVTSTPNAHCRKRSKISLPLGKDCRYRLIFGPHLFILSHLRWGKKINLAAFLYQSLEHFVHLARDGDGAILHQGLLYLVFSVACPPIPSLSTFPPGRDERAAALPPLPPRPSPVSLRSSSRRRRLHISSYSDSDVAILGSSHDATTPSAPLVPPPPSSYPILPFSWRTLPPKCPSPVFSPNVSHTKDILGLAQLYPDSPNSVQMETTQPFVDTNIHNAGDDLDSANSSPRTNSPLSPPNQDLNPAKPVVADSARDERRVELVSSILSKL